MVNLLKEDNIEDFKEVLSMFAHYFQYREYHIVFEDFKKIDKTIKLKKEDKEVIPLSFDYEDLKRLLKVSDKVKSSNEIIQKLIDNIDTKYELTNEDEFVKNLNKLYENQITKEVLNRAFALSSLANITAGHLTGIKFSDSTNRDNYIVIKANKYSIPNISMYRFKKVIKDRKEVLKLVDISHKNEKKGTKFKSDLYHKVSHKCFSQEIKYVTHYEALQKKRSK